MSLKQNLIINTFWSIGGIVGNGIIQLLANIIFARYLTPIEFGQVGIVMFFVLISNVLIEGGLGGALVRKIETTDKDYSTVFIFNLIVSLFLYIILILNANIIANFYNDSKLKILIIATGSILLINAFTLVHNSKLVKELQFKKISKYRLLSVVLANIVGVLLVLFNLGIWSYIVSILLTPFFQSIMLWTNEKAFGKLVFSKESFKSLYVFGLNTTIATIIDTTFNNIYQLVLGRYFTLQDVGFYFQSKKLQDVPNSLVFGTTNTVIFSGLSKFQNDQKKFIEIYNTIVSYFSILIGIITLLIMTFTKEIIVILFGQKWEDSSFYLFVLTIASFFYVHEMFNRIIFKIFNKTELILKLELIKKSILSASIIVGIYLLNLKILLYGFILVSIVAYLINYFYTKKILQIKSWHELISILKVIFAILISYIIIVNIKIYAGMNIYYSIILVPLTMFLFLAIMKIQGFKLSYKEIKLSFLN